MYIFLSSDFFHHIKYISAFSRNIHLTKTQEQINRNINTKNMKKWVMCLNNFGCVYD